MILSLLLERVDPKPGTVAVLGSGFGLGPSSMVLDWALPGFGLEFWIGPLAGSFGLGQTRFWIGVLDWSFGLGVLDWGFGWFWIWVFEFWI